MPVLDCLRTPYNNNASINSENPLTFTAQEEQRGHAEQLEDRGEIKKPTTHELDNAACFVFLLFWAENLSKRHVWNSIKKGYVVYMDGYFYVSEAAISRIVRVIRFGTRQTLFSTHAPPS